MSKPAAIVTGSAARIGARIAQAFAEAGWHVIIHYHDSDEEARALADSLASAEIVQCDLADGDAAVAMIRDVTARLPDCRVLVNNAALFPLDSATNLDPQTNKAVMQVNAETPARMAQAFLASAQAKGGRRVIQITDQKLRNPNPDFFSYTMSKHALASTIPMLAMGSCNEDDRVYGLAPGAILASHDQSEVETDVSHRLNLLGRKTHKNEIAQAAVFLARGALANGQTLFVDSGQHLMSQPRDVIFLAREGQAE